MEKLVATKSGFSVVETSSGVSVKKSAVSFLDALFFLPFIVTMPILAMAGMFLAVYIPLAIIYEPGQGDAPVWAGIALGVMFLLGSGVAWWVLGGLIVILLPVEKKVDCGQGWATCRSSIFCLVYWRRTLKYPLSVVAQVYDAHGDPCFRMFLKDTDGRRFFLTIPTVVGGSLACAKKTALTLAAPISRRLDAEIVVERRGRRGWLPPEKFSPGDRSLPEEP